MKRGRIVVSVTVIATLAMAVLAWAAPPIGSVHASPILSAPTRESGSHLIADADNSRTSGESPMIPSLSGGGEYPLSATIPPTPTTLTSPNAQAGGSFGWSVAISGTTAVVGAPDETAFGLHYAGHAYVVDTKTDLVTMFSSPDAQTDGYFGWSVAASGTTVVVGAPSENASGYVAGGHAYVINTATGVVTVLTSPNAQTDGYFGSSVAISGTTVVVGAPSENASGYVAGGHAYIVNTATGVVTVLTSPNAQTGGDFGSSVAISGTTVVVGAFEENASGYVRAGHAYVFSATTGALIDSLASPNARENGYFGYSVAISGTTVVVGAMGEGHAYAFSATTGVLIATLTSPPNPNDESFGLSVGISGATAVVGAPFETASVYNFAGRTYTFSLPSGSLILGNFTSPNAQQGFGYFGSSVAISGTTVVAGAWHEAVAGLYDAGHAYVFTDLPLTLTSPNAREDGYFGLSVAISGTTVVVGAPSENASGYVAGGHAYVINTATEVVTVLTSPNVQTDGDFGSSVAISGTTVVVGAFGETASGHSDAGHAYAFNATTGALIDTLTSPHARTHGYFGSAVSVSGNIIVVGAWGETVLKHKDAGHAYTFNAATGKLIATLVSPNAQEFGLFGISVAITGTAVVVGAPGENASGVSDAGHAYTFNAKTGTIISTLTSPNALLDGSFGVSVAISGTTMVVGADGETASGYAGAGHAYAFNATTGALIFSLASPNAQKAGDFGIRVAISGTTVVVGAYGETALGYAHAGNAYVFSATTGAPIVTLTSFNTQTGGWFGFSVGISGTTVVVGARGETASGYKDAGHAYLF